jgi:hypothetical protein
MSTTVDYYIAPQSPWTYLGHQRFVQMAKAAGATVRLMPMDLGKVFPLSGGLPLGKRAPQRQAYRLVELTRFSKALGIPLNLHPQFFPVAGDAAARLIIAVDLHQGTDAALTMAGAAVVVRGPGGARSAACARSAFPDAISSRATPSETSAEVPTSCRLPPSRKARVTMMFTAATPIR